jgi:hypothetical protein
MIAGVRHRTEIARRIATRITHTIRIRALPTNGCAISIDRIGIDG